MRLGRVHQREQLGPRASVAVLARERSAVGRREPCRVGDEVAVDGVAAGLVEREVDADVHAAVAEVPVRDAVHVVLLHERLEVAQVGAEVGRRHGGVLPPRQSGRVEGAGRQPRAFLTHAPQDRLLAGFDDMTMGEGVGRGDDTGGDRGELGSVLAGQLDVEEAVAGRQVGHRAGAVGRPEDLDDAGVEALARLGPEREHRRHVVGGVGHGRVAEHHEVAERGVAHQVDRGSEQDAEGALGAGHERRDVEAALREQVLQAVPRHLTAERPHLGPHGGQLAGDHRAQALQGRRRGRDVAAEREPLPRRRDDVETGHVVGAASVAERVVAAGVVADHAADRAARVGRRVRTVSKAVRCGRTLQGRVDDARVDDRRAGFRVDRMDPVEVLDEVDHDTRADGVAGDGGAGSTCGQWHPRGGAGVDDREHLVDVTRPHHDARHDAVERRVGAVERSRQRGVVDVRDAGLTKRFDDI